MRTRKGTGFYKIPSLRGLWYRPRLLHDASILTLEELFDPARLDPEYERKGWSPPGVTKGAIPGLEFLTKLSQEDKVSADRVFAEPVTLPEVAQAMQMLNAERNPFSIQH